jgi:peptide/nickel transport system substrate-binding protein
MTPLRLRAVAAGLMGCCALATAVAVVGCGKSEEPVGGSATVAMATAPDHLDPQLAYSTEAAEADWLAYTPLLTYRHESGSAGTELIPGLALRMPRISREGVRYRFALRKGLVYSNGEPVEASDFEYTVERALRLGWPGRKFLTDNVVGAEAYATGQARQISGITSDDAHEKLSIKLRRANGAFENVLALPALGLVPAGTPMKDLSSRPPPGVGAYRIVNVAPGRHWTMARNTRFGSLEIPNIPEGSLDRIYVKVEPDPRRALRAVLQNRSDGFDPGSPLPPGTLAHIRTVADGRFDSVPIPSTTFFFLNTAEPPFSSELARRAVITALDRPAMARLSKGALQPDCYLVPDGIAGHPSAGCPYGSADGSGDVKAGRRLAAESGAAGSRVTVWVENGVPERAYGRAYTKLLNRLGFRASLAVAPDARRFGSQGGSRSDPQTGFETWFNDFPNPADFYRVLDAASIGSPYGPNRGHVKDVFIQQELNKLMLVPGQSLDSAAADWSDLDQYSAEKAYLAVLGDQQVPKLMSSRMDFGEAVIHPLFLSDWSTWALH